MLPSFLCAQLPPLTFGDFCIVAWRHAKPLRNCRTDHRPLGLRTPTWDERAAAAGRLRCDRATRHSELHQRGTLGKADKRAPGSDLFPGSLVNGIEIPRHLSQLYVADSEGFLVLHIVQWIDSRSSRVGLTTAAVSIAYGNWMVH